MNMNSLSKMMVDGDIVKLEPLKYMAEIQGLRSGQKMNEIGKTDIKVVDLLLAPAIAK